MKELIITPKVIADYRSSLVMAERSMSTVKKYLHDVNCFLVFLDGRKMCREEVLLYKEKLGKDYATSSANSMIASLNSFFKYVGMESLCVKQFKVQRKIFCDDSMELTKDEYYRLVECAKKTDERLGLIVETICSTGIRVSELEAITVESMKLGEATVDCKGKRRQIFLVSSLCKKLNEYVEIHKIESGPIFVTRGGTPISRYSIWRGMKALCAKAGVEESKVFPHNLRHLFARSFYDADQDIVKLADVLGHTNIDTTRIYIMTKGSEHRERIETLGLVT